MNVIWDRKQEGRNAFVSRVFAAFLTLLPLLTLFTSCTSEVPEGSEMTSERETVNRSPYLLGVTNQKASAVEVYDIGKGVIGAESLIWQFPCSEYNIAGLKLRKYKGEEVMLAAYGVNSAIMVSYPGKTVLWKTAGTANNPHSIELIPFSDDSYLIAVAASSGAEVRFFDPEGADPETAIHALPYADAHGLLYDPDGECLWIWGTNQLSKYRVEKNGNKVKTELMVVYTAPSSSGHDLAPVYGDRNLLWLSTGSTVYQFNKTTGVFSTTYPEELYLKRSKVKGLGNFPDGSIVWIVPDGAFESWTSATVSFAKRNSNGSGYADFSLTSETGGFYKIRVWSSDYQ